MIGFLLAVALSGLVVGALARLVVPGRQPMGCWATMAVGVAGSIVGGLIGRVLFGRNYAPGLIMSTLVAAALVAILFRSPRTARR